MDILKLFVIAVAALQSMSAQNLPCPEICRCYLTEKGSFAVNCSDKVLTDLPEGIDEQVQILDISNNFFDAIPSRIRFIPGLEELHMSGNKISRLSSHSLYNMTALRYLDLSNNLITSWKDISANKLLKPVEHLQHLILSKNNLTSFSSVRSVEVLYSDSLNILEMEHCGISLIFGKAPIVGLTNLKKLIMTHNPLKRFQNLQSSTLEYLDLSFCELSYLYGDEFDFLPSLTHFIISDNYRLNLNPYLSSSTIGFLDISYCNMDKISLVGMYNLREANLRGNMLRKLKAGSFTNNSMLITLDLSSNAIELIEEDAFEGLTSLKMLNLSVNVIPHIPDKTFTRTPALAFLYLARNYLSSVGNFRATNLNYLDMSVCEIQTITYSAFTRMPHLLKINLSKNMIGTLPDNLKSDSLQVIDLSYNRLSFVNNSTFQSLPSLTTLLVSENRFTEVWKVSYFNNNTHLSELALHGNTWQCDCSKEMLDFFQFVANDPPKVWHLSDLQCSIPANLNGKNWLDACYFIWNPGNVVQERERVLVFLLTIAVCFFGCFCAVWLIRQSMRRKMEAARSEQERESEAARDRMREQRMRREQEEERNAPDPRDLISPPSYDEALLMPRIDGSYYSLADVGTDETKQKRRQKRKSRSSGDLLDEVKRSERRKRRPRRESTTNVTNATNDEETPLNRHVVHQNSNPETEVILTDNHNRQSDVQVVIHMHESDL